MTPTRRQLHLLAAGAAVLGTSFGASPWCAGVAATWILPAGFVVALLTMARPTVECPLLRHRQWRRTIAGTWALLTAAFLIGPNLQAQWSIIDDHEIVHTLGPDERLSLSALCDLLAQHREFGQPSPEWPRYRPSYYLLRFLECFCWGGRPALWYGFRLGLLSLSLGLFWHFLWRWIGALGASLLLLATLTYDFWTDTWSRLGPAETYAIVGVALCLHGLNGLTHRRPPRQPWRPWLLLTIGALMAMGSKENFLVLLPATWLLTIWLWRRRRLTVSAWLSLAVVTAVGVFIAAIVVRSLRHGQVDVYQASVAPSDRLSLLLPACGLFFQRIEGKILSIGALVVVALWCYAFRARPASRRFLRRAADGSVLAIAGTGLLLASQYVFYNGDWPSRTTPRYDFPGLLVFPALAAGGMRLLLSLLRIVGVKPLGRHFIFGCFLGGLTAVVLTRGFALPDAVADNVAYTRWFTVRLDTIVARLQAEPARPVVFVSHSGWDYEPILSLKRFLAARGVRNPIFLRLDGYGPENHRHPSAIDMARQLRELSVTGSSGALAPPWTFEPMDRLPRGVTPFGIGFSGPVGVEMENLGVIW